MKNPHAQALGRRAKGVPKTMSEAALEQRRSNFAEINAARKKAARKRKKRKADNAKLSDLRLKPHVDERTDGQATRNQ